MLSGTFRKLDLNAHERRIFRLIFLSGIFNGLVSSVYTILPEIARKTLLAHESVISLITLAASVSNLFAVYWTPLLRNPARRTRTLLVAALMGRLPLALGAVFATVWPILFLTVAYVLTSAGVWAAMTALVHETYREHVRGRLISFYILAQTLSALLAVMGAGFLMEYNEQFYRLFLVLAAFFGLLEVGCMIVARRLVPTGADGRSVALRGTPSPVFEATPSPANSLSLGRRLGRPWTELWRLFRREPTFWRYEINFFVYGFGFMILQPFLTLFFVNDLRLSYSEIGLAKGTIFQLGIVLMSPWMGRLMDRQHPIRFAAIAFLTISLFPVILALAAVMNLEHPVYFVYLAYGIWGVGMTAVILVWDLGQMHFCGSQDVVPFTNAHVAMVGLRGLLAMIVTALLVTVVPPLWAFLASALLWIAASGLMFRQYRDERQAAAGSRAESKNHL